MTFEFDVTKDKLKPLKPLHGVTGNVNFYMCGFSFSDHWEKLSKFAVFIGKENYVADIDDGVCIVPFEILQSEGEVYIGVFGTNGTNNLKRISTNLVSFDIDTGAFREGAQAIEKTTPDVWEEYINEINSYCQRAESAAASAEKMINDAKFVKTEGNQEITGVKTFSGGIVTDSIKGGDYLQQKAQFIEMEGTDNIEVYSPEGSVFLGTDSGDVTIYDDKIRLNGKTFINDKEIKDPLEKDDIKFDGNSLTVNEVITDCISLGGQTIYEEQGTPLINGEKIATEKSVKSEIEKGGFVHKTGDEEIEGVKSFKGVTKVKVISGMPKSEDDDTQNILIDATNPTGDGGGFVNIEADTEISLKAHSIYLTSETGDVSLNGSEVATAENLPRIVEETKLNKVTAEAFEIYDGGGKYGDIEGTEVFDYEDEDGNPHYASAIKIKTEKLFHNDKEVATKDDISTALGDIETALDTAITLCDSLMGGAV